MRALIVSGIWPPDPGGPASHAPALAWFLHGRGHQVEVVTTAQRAPAPEPYPVRWTTRLLPPGLRHLAVTAAIARRARESDVVYATSMIRRAAIGATLARRPLVVKLVSDEVFERQARAGRFVGTLEAFQSVSDGRVSFLRSSRNWALRRARHVFCPSAYLSRFAVSWGVDPARASVLPNPAPTLPNLPSREDARSDLGLEGRVLAFAGRLGVQKSLEIALEAVAAVPEVTLAIAGEGPERARLERVARDRGLDGRARFLGSLSREDVLGLFRAADASLISSSWENFPHTVVESLAVGTPVIATAVGGIPEIVEHGSNGLLVRPGDPEGLADAIRRFFADEDLRSRLSRAAPAAVAGHTESAVFEQIEDELARVART